MPVKFATRGFKETQAFLKTVPHGAKKIVIPAVSEYIIGNDAHGLKHYPAPQGQKYVRTYILKNNWRVTGDVYRQKIVNLTPYAPYVPPRWKHYGWREWSDVIASNMAGALRSANARLNEWLRSHGK